MIVLVYGYYWWMRRMRKNELVITEEGDDERVNFKNNYRFSMYMVHDMFINVDVGEYTIIDKKLLYSIKNKYELAMYHDMIVKKHNTGLFTKNELRRIAEDLRQCDRDQLQVMRRVNEVNEKNVRMYYCLKKCDDKMNYLCISCSYEVCECRSVSGDSQCICRIRHCKECAIQCNIKKLYELYKASIKYIVPPEIILEIWKYV